MIGSAVWASLSLAAVAMMWLNWWGYPMACLGLVLGYFSWLSAPTSTISIKTFTLNHRGNTLSCLCEARSLPNQIWVPRVAPGSMARSHVQPKQSSLNKDASAFTAAQS